MFAPNRYRHVGFLFPENPCGFHFKLKLEEQLLRFTFSNEEFVVPFTNFEVIESCRFISFFFLSEKSAEECVLFRLVIAVVGAFLVCHHLASLLADRRDRSVGDQIVLEDPPGSKNAALRSRNIYLAHSPLGQEKKKTKMDDR